MPIYVQHCVACQHTFDDYRPMAKYNANPHCPKCHNNTARLVAPIVSELDWDKPIASEAMACSPEDVPARERMTGVKHTPDGRPILHNRAERTRFMQATGFHDRAGYYRSK